MNKKFDRAIKLAFVLYVLLMLYLLFFQRSGGVSEINLIPFRTIREFWITLVQGFGTKWGESLFIGSLINLGGNILMFVPLGLFPPLMWKALRGFARDMALCAVLIIAVEATQFATGLGCADIDDLILNMLGAAIGWLIFARILNRTKPESR